MSKFWLKTKSILKVILEDYIKFPLRLLTSPIQGFTEFKDEKKGKLSVAVVFLLLASLLAIIRFNNDGIIINTNNPEKFNSVTILIYTIFPPIILAVANWTITTLMNGKGKMKEIMTLAGYCYFPTIIISFVNLILSNVLIQSEVQFITLLNILGYVLMGYMIFMGMIVIHEYGVFQTIATVLLTILATLVILFIALLIFDLSQQIYGFFYSLYDEIVTRFF